MPWISAQALRSRPRAPLRWLLVAVLLCLTTAAAQAQIRIVALGDSSFRGGPGMRDAHDALPYRLELALRQKGYDVTVANEGINGERSFLTRTRIGPAVPNDTRIVLISTGGNDLILDKASRASVHTQLKLMVETLRGRGIEVLLFSVGGKVTREEMAEETRDFRALGAVVVPPMQSGGLLDRTDLHVESVWQPGTTLWHLNRQGNDVVVERILPQVEMLIGRVKAKQG